MAQLPQPHPFPIALALALGSLLLFQRRPVLAGVLCGVCAAWRLEFAGYLAVGVILALAIRPLPGPDRLRAGLKYVVSALLVAAALFAPVVAAAGLSKTWDLVIRYPIIDFGKYQGLPFPLSYDGPLNTSSVGGFLSDSFENMLQFYLPLALLVGAGGVADRAAPARAAGGLGLAGRRRLRLGMAHYLIVRPDEFHTAPLAVMVSVLAAWAVGQTRLRVPVPHRRRKVHATMPFPRGAAGPYPGQVKPAEPLLARREGQAAAPDAVRWRQRRAPAAAAGAAARAGRRPGPDLRPRRGPGRQEARARGGHGAAAPRGRRRRAGQPALGRPAGAGGALRRRPRAAGAPDLRDHAPVGPRDLRRPPVLRPRAAQQPDAVRHRRPGRGDLGAGAERDRARPRADPDPGRRALPVAGHHGAGAQPGGPVHRRDHPRPLPGPGVPPGPRFGYYQILLRKHQARRVTAGERGKRSA